MIQTDVRRERNKPNGPPEDQAALSDVVFMASGDNEAEPHQSSNRKRLDLEETKVPSSPGKRKKKKRKRYVGSADMRNLAFDESQGVEGISKDYISFGNSDSLKSSLQWNSLQANNP